MNTADRVIRSSAALAVVGAAVVAAVVSYGYPGFGTRGGRTACTQRGLRMLAVAAAGVLDDADIALRYQGNGRCRVSSCRNPGAGMWREPVVPVHADRDDIV
jgi:hypothetical protein